MTRDLAESMAIQGLTFLADDSDRLQRFLATTGVGPQQIRSAAREPEFLAGILNYLAADEELLVTFAAYAGIDPFNIRRAGNVLMPDNWERDVP